MYIENITTLGFTVDRKAFAKALATCAKVAEKKSTLPILSHALVAIEPDRIKITATDLDLTITQELPAATVGTGSLCVPLFTLKDAISKWKGAAVELVALSADKAAVKCPTGGARINLATRAAEDFPEMQRPAEWHASFRAPVDMFAGSLAAALPFTSNEETRYYLRGVFLHATLDGPLPERTAEHEKAMERLEECKSALQVAVNAELGEEMVTKAQGAVADALAECEAFEIQRHKPDCLRFAATDGHRLMRVTQPLPDEAAAGVPDMIIPAKACKILGHLVGKRPAWQDVGVSAAPSKLELSYGHSTLLLKLIDGSFPDYSRVIPHSNDKRLTVPAAAFADAIRSVTSVSAEKTRGLSLSLDSEEGIILSCSSPEAGRSAVVFEGGSFADGSERAQLAIGLNAGYVETCLAPFGDGEAVFDFADPAAPVRISSPDRPELLEVLMPMRTDAQLMTRADVEEMNLDPWQKIKRRAGTIAAGLASIDNHPDLGTYGRSEGRRAYWTQYILPAIEFLVSAGEARAVARLMVKAELARAVNVEEAERLARIVAAYRAERIQSAAAEPAAGLVSIEAAEPPVAPETDSHALGDASIAIPADHEAPVSAVEAIEPVPANPEPEEAETLCEADPAPDTGPMAPAKDVEPGDDGPLAAVLAELAALRERVAMLEAERRNDVGTVPEEETSEARGAVECQVNSAKPDFSRARRLRLVRRYLALRAARAANRKRIAELEETHLVASNDLIDARQRLRIAEARAEDAEFKMSELGDQLAAETARADEEKRRADSADERWQPRLDEKQARIVALENEKLERLSGGRIKLPPANGNAVPVLLRAIAQPMAGGA